MLRTFFYDHPHYHLKLFPTTTFGEIFLNHVIAGFFTYTMVSAIQWYQHNFLANLDIHLSTAILTYFCIILSRLDAL